MLLGRPPDRASLSHPDVSNGTMVGKRPQKGPRFTHSVRSG